MRYRFSVVASLLVGGAALAQPAPAQPIDPYASPVQLAAPPLTVIDPYGPATVAPACCDSTKRARV